MNQEKVVVIPSATAAVIGCLGIIVLILTLAMIGGVYTSPNDPRLPMMRFGKSVAALTIIPFMFSFFKYRVETQYLRAARVSVELARVSPALGFGLLLLTQ